jgi:hypothetical protein
MTIRAQISELAPPSPARLNRSPTFLLRTFLAVHIVTALAGPALAVLILAAAGLLTASGIALPLVLLTGLSLFTTLILLTALVRILAGLTWILVGTLGTVWHVITPAVVTTLQQ